MDRGAVVVGEVHRDLGLVALRDLEAERLDRRKSPVPLPHGLGDRLGDRDVRGGEVDVVGDQDRPGPDRHDPGRRVDPGVPEIRGSLGLGRDRVPDALEPPSADLGEVRALGPPGRLGVEVDRQTELRPDPLGEPFGEGDRRPPSLGVSERDDRHDVDGPHPGVLPGVAG